MLVELGYYLDLFDVMHASLERSEPGLGGRFLVCCDVSPPSFWVLYVGSAVDINRRAPDPFLSICKGTSRL